MSVYSLEGISPTLPDDDEYWIAPTASVIGRVRLEPLASIWFGAVARGDNEEILIGRRSNVQDLCVMHTDMGFPLTIGEDCTIGHGATLHGCTIGENCLIGIGATLLNGAVIGNNCVIGAHTLIGEGKNIPDNSLVVGAPGRIIRKVGPEDEEKLRHSAAHYVEHWQRYKDSLKPE